MYRHLCYAHHRLGDNHYFFGLGDMSNGHVRICVGGYAYMYRT